MIRPMMIGVRATRTTATGRKQGIRRFGCNWNRCVRAQGGLKRRFGEATSISAIGKRQHDVRGILGWMFVFHMLWYDTCNDKWAGPGTGVGMTAERLPTNGDLVRERSYSGSLLHHS